MLISIWRNFRESSTTPFDVGSTRWSGFRRLKIKIDHVDAKIFFHLRKSSYLFKIGCGGVVVWWNREEVALHHSTASHLSCVPLKCSLSPVPLWASLNLKCEAREFPPHPSRSGLRGGLGFVDENKKSMMLMQKYFFIYEIP